MVGQGSMHCFAPPLRKILKAYASVLSLAQYGNPPPPQQCARIPCMPTLQYCTLNEGCRYRCVSRTATLYLFKTLSNLNRTRECPTPVCQLYVHVMRHITYGTVLHHLSLGKSSAISTRLWRF